VIKIKERDFVKIGIKKFEVEEFLAKEFAKAGYSHCDIQRTPLSTRVLVFAQKPGMVIGRGGKIIESTTRLLKKNFGFENPQLDVKEIIHPNLDAMIVASQIASAIDRGLNYRRVANLTIDRIMRSGAVGVAIRIGGKVGGDKSRFEKFSAGYLKYSGNPAETAVRKAYAEAKVKLGLIGIQVRILVDRPKELTILENIEKGIEANNARQAEKEEQKLDAGVGEVKKVIDAAVGVVKEGAEKIVKKVEEIVDGDKKVEPVKADAKPIETKSEASPVEEVKETAEKVEEKVEDVVEKVEEKVEEVKEKVEDMAEEAKEKVKEVVEEVKDDVERVVEKVKEVVEGTKE
jgi:small subunit ribosomal protein S3